jgi:hypothetical protein
MSIVHDGRSDELDLSSARMLDLDDKLSCFHLRMIKCLGDVIDGTEWDPGDCQSDLGKISRILRVFTQAH